MVDIVNDVTVSAGNDYVDVVVSIENGDNDFTITFDNLIREDTFVDNNPLVDLGTLYTNDVVITGLIEGLAAGDTIVFA